MEYFVGLTLPEKAVQRLEELRSPCIALTGGVVKIPATPLHLTLIPPFKGDGLDMDEVVANLRTVHLEQPGLLDGVALEADGIALFRDNEVAAAVIAYKPTHLIQQLLRRVRTNCRIGNPNNSKIYSIERFTPHVTLVKSRNIEDQPDIEKKMAAITTCLQERFSDSPDLQQILLQELAIFHREHSTSWTIRSHIPLLAVPLKARSS